MSQALNHACGCQLYGFPCFDRDPGVDVLMYAATCMNDRFFHTTRHRPQSADAFFVLRARAAKIWHYRNGLRVVVRRADHERPLCGEVEGSDVMKELPKFSLGSYAHSSIRVQEGQPNTSEISDNSVAATVSGGVVCVKAVPDDHTPSLLGETCRNIPPRLARPTCPA